MQPRDTTYHIMITPGERILCEQFRTQHGAELHKFGHPTVYAVRDNRLIAYLSSYIEDGMLVCGPAVFADTVKRPYVFMRLAEAFDQIVAAAGVTSYLCAIPADQAAYREQIERLGYTFIEDAGSHYWYRRNLKE